MREIKFRGYNKNYGWVYGSLNNCNQNEIVISCFDESLPFNSKIVLNESVGQFTGLKDKDRVEVYEGDIFENGWVVSFKNGMFGIFNYGMHMAINAYMCQYREVVGNIHENPELLAVPTAVL